jgi:tRNA G10  N-methylase Trm11
VTDLPYGKNSKLDGSLNILINDFFEHFKNLTKKVVVCTPNSFDVKHISSKHGWKLNYFFDIYIHGSLTRRVHVLSI